MAARGTRGQRAWRCRSGGPAAFPLPALMAMAAAMAGTTPARAQDAAGPEVLTKENYERILFGPEKKAAFVKFFAPWCGYCKKIKEDWDQLGRLFFDSPTLVIAQVDCTTDEAEAVCEAFGVSGYPTLKYLKAGATHRDDAQDYRGERAYAGFKAFAEEELLGEPNRCDPSDKAFCRPSELTLLKDLSSADSNRLEELLMEAKLEREERRQAKVRALVELEVEYKKDRAELSRKVKLLTRLLKERKENVEVHGRPGHTEL